MDFENNFDDELNENEFTDELPKNKIKYIYEFLEANSKKELIDKLELINSKNNNYCFKSSEAEYYYVDESDIETQRLKEQQMSLFQEIQSKPEEICSICKNDFDKIGGLIFNNEYYYWENDKDYMFMNKCKFKTIHFNICKKCFIK